MNLKIPVNGKTEEFKPANGTTFELEELQSAVGGNIEFVYPKENHIMVVDEEGVLKGKPLNTAASFLAGIPIVGDVAIVQEKFIE